MQLTPGMLGLAYELLQTTPPYCRWKLPPLSEVRFGFLDSLHGPAGDYCKEDGRHFIRVNKARCGNLTYLVQIVAHEMVHMRQTIAYPRDKAHHGRRFRALAASVCRHHHMDPKSF